MIRIPVFLRIVVTAFSTCSLKTQLYHLESNIPSPSCTPTRRSRTEILWIRGALPHTSPYTTQYLFMYSLFENKRAIFTKF
jgi:hypothetical protein